MKIKTNIQKEDAQSNESYVLKLKKKLFISGILATLVIMFYYVFWLNTVSIINQSDHNLENITINKSYARDRNPILWKGKITANSKKYIFIPAGTSGDSIVLVASWRGKDIIKEQEYPVMGPGKFKFILSEDGQIDSQVTEVPLSWLSLYN